MPELPEVETTRCGIAPHISGERVTRCHIRQHKLRWPIPDKLENILQQQKLHSIDRRAKYLLLNFDSGILIIHLGMSGGLRIVSPLAVAEKHDHVDIVFSNKKVLRFHDPRRFGAILWTTKPIQQHKLISHLGPEPLSHSFDADYLVQQCKRRKGPIKNVIMDQKVVVGVGNIYASEALFASGIHPSRAACQISKKRLAKLTDEIQTILRLAIGQGGTTLKDFTNAEGKPGYFKQSLKVYGRESEACETCSRPVKKMLIGQRSSFYCSHCQK